MSDSSFPKVLSNPNFFRLWLGQIISSVGDRFYQFALLSVVLGIHQGTEIGKESSRVIFCGMIPSLLFAPCFGWIIDHFSRRSVMIISDLARALLTLSFIYFWFYLHSFFLVFTAIFLMGAMSGLFIPARQSALPQLVPARQLVTANALIALVGVIASLIGGIFAGLIVSIFGARSSFAFNSLGFLSSAWLIFRIDNQLSPQTLRNRFNMAQTWHDISAGLRLVIKDQELRGLIVLNSLFAFASGIFVITVLEHTAEEVDLSAIERLVHFLIRVLTPLSPKPPTFELRVLGFSILFAVVGLGLGMGVVFCGKSKRWSHLKGLPYFSLIILGLCMVVFSHLTDYGSALIGCLILGFLSSVLVIPIEARIQHQVSDQVRGRVFALRNFCTTAAFLVALGINLNGALLHRFGATWMISSLGWTVTGVALILSVLNASQLTTFWEVREPVLPVS